MPSDLTVTFGGRSVVLRQTAPQVWRGEFLSIAGDGSDWGVALGVGILKEAASGVSAQSAVYILESKLRSLRDEIDRVLGETR